MRLRDLDARLLDHVTLTGRHMRQSDQVEGAQGLMFQCPSCAAGKDIQTDHERPGRRYVVGAHYIEILFSNPRGVELAPSDAGVEGSDGSRPRWTIESGVSLDDVTLAPSINCDIPQKDGTPSVCKFHGYVKNGDAS